MRKLTPVDDAIEVRGCPWSKSFRPVPGWDVIKVSSEDSYKVVRCHCVQERVMCMVVGNKKEER